MNLHVSSKIHKLFLAFFTLGLGVSQIRAVENMYSIVGVVGSRRGSHMSHPRYFACSLRVMMWRHPRME